MFTHSRNARLVVMAHTFSPGRGSARQISEFEAILFDRVSSGQTARAENPQTPRMHAAVNPAVKRLV